MNFSVVVFKVTFSPNSVLERANCMLTSECGAYIVETLIGKDVVPD